MMFFKIFSGFAAIAFGAAVMLALPGFSPEVEARTPPPAVKGDRLDRQPAPDCSEQAWPYYTNTCLRDRAQTQPRQVRVIPIDRVTR